MHPVASLIIFTDRKWFVLVSIGQSIILSPFEMCCRALFESTAFKTVFTCLATLEHHQSGWEQLLLSELQKCRKRNPESFVNGESAESVVVRRNTDSRPSTASAPTISNRDPSSLNPADNAVPSPRDSRSQNRESLFA